MAAVLPMSADTIRKYSVWFLIYGSALILLGAFAILAPGLATLAVEVTVGWLLLIGGVFGLAAVARAGTAAPGFWWNLLTAIVCLVAGGLLLWNPIAGVLTLTVVLAAYLVATGATKIAAALAYRRTLPGAWLWMLLSALVDVALGVVIMLGLPGAAFWVLGLFVGINLLFTGIAVAIAAFSCRRLGRRQGTHGPAAA